MTEPNRWTPTVDSTAHLGSEPCGHCGRKASEHYGMQMFCEALPGRVYPAFGAQPPFVGNDNVLIGPSAGMRTDPHDFPSARTLDS